MWVHTDTGCGFEKEEAKTHSDYLKQRKAVKMRICVEVYKLLWDKHNEG